VTREEEVVRLELDEPLPEKRFVIYGKPIDPDANVWRYHRMGGCVIRLDDPETLRNLEVERLHRLEHPEQH
jgi:hypothetical protein